MPVKMAVSLRETAKKMALTTSIIIGRRERAKAKGTGSLGINSLLSLRCRRSSGKRIRWFVDPRCRGVSAIVDDMLYARAEGEEHSRAGEDQDESTRCLFSAELKESHG